MACGLDLRRKWCHRSCPHACLRLGRDGPWATPAFTGGPCGRVSSLWERGGFLKPNWSCPIKALYCSEGCAQDTRAPEGTGCVQSSAIPEERGCENGKEQSVWVALRCCSASVAAMGCVTVTACHSDQGGAALLYGSPGALRSPRCVGVIQNAMPNCGARRQMPCPPPAGPWGMRLATLSHCYQQSVSILGLWPFGC